jgi:signal peptidase I
VKRGRRVLSIALTAALVAVWFVLFRPSALGGWVTYVVIRGDSMLPTYEPGDLVVLTPRASYGDGDVVGYRVPAGELGAGLLVVHRIVDAAGDRFILRGDNNPAPDPWEPRAHDVAGTVVAAAPGLGRTLAWIRQPAVIAAAAAAIVVWLVARRPTTAPVRRVEDDDRRIRRSGRAPRGASASRQHRRRSATS